MLHSKPKPYGTQTPLLSILILSLPDRVEKYLTPLLRSLYPQIEHYGEEVELIVLTDNKWRSIGAKRNQCIQVSSGRFFVFIDDDDMISSDYIESIVSSLRTDPSLHCVVFDCWVTGYDILGLQPKEGSLCRYGVELPHQNLPTMFLRKPNHLMVYRRDLVQHIPFQHINAGEDDRWGQEVSTLVNPQKQYRINKIMYFYQWQPSNSQAGGSDAMRVDLVFRGLL